MRLLIVEDDRTWAKALKDFYGTLFGDEANIDWSDTGTEAIEKLENKSFDLVSLDINLGSIHQNDGASGLDVLERAATARKEGKGCSAVLIISGMQHDATLSNVIHDGESVTHTRATFGHKVDFYFPKKHIILGKPENLLGEKVNRDDIDEYLNRLLEPDPRTKKEIISRKKLLMLCDLVNVFYLNEDAGTLKVIFGGENLKEREVRGQARKGKPATTEVGFQYIKRILESREIYISKLAQGVLDTSKRQELNGYDEHEGTEGLNYGLGNVNISDVYAHLEVVDVLLPLFEYAIEKNLTCDTEDEIGCSSEVIFSDNSFSALRTAGEFKKNNADSLPKIWNEYRRTLSKKSLEDALNELKKSQYILIEQTSTQEKSDERVRKQKSKSADYESVRKAINRARDELGNDMATHLKNCIKYDNSIYRYTGGLEWITSDPEAE